MFQERGQRFLLELPAIRNDLPFSPALLQKLFVQTGEESTATLTAIGDTLSEDQGLTTRILAMANSAYYGLESEVKTVARAVAVLGLIEVRNLVLALGVRSLARKHPLPDGFGMAAYWEHQLAVAMAARILAKGAPGGTDPDLSFTAGVLHDLGKIITALYRPEDYLAEAALAAAESLPWHEAEARHFGLDHGLIGAILLKSWNLPSELTEPVNWHHAPSHAPAFAREALLLCAADALIWHLYAPEAPNRCPWEKGLALLRLPVAPTVDKVAAALAAKNPALLAAGLA